MNRNIRIARELIRIAKEIAHRNQIKDWDDITDIASLTEEDMNDIAELCFPFMVASAKTMGMSRADAEDAKQNFVTKLIVLCRNGHFKKLDYDYGRSKLSTYFNTMAYRTLIDFGRRNRRFKGDDIIEDTQNYVDKNLSNVPGYDSQYDEIKNEFMEKAAEALHSICNKKLCQALKMSLFEEKSNKEIAEALGVEEDYASVAKNRYLPYIKSKLRHLHDDMIEGPIVDGFRNASDFVQDLLGSEEFWKVYESKYGDLS